MPVIDLLRHGETQQPCLLLGRTDVALSEAGWRQFERQTATREWSMVATSPLRRSREPAAKLAHARGLPIQIDPDWSEMDFGDWDGRSIAELRGDPTIASQLDAFYRSSIAVGPPNGDSWSDIRTRVDRALNNLLDRQLDGAVLVVTHGGAIRAALSCACAIPLDLTWAFKISHATRVTLRVERGDNLEIWGEIIEVVQP